jgi:hypothetical protein
VDSPPAPWRPIGSPLLRPSERSWHPCGAPLPANLASPSARPRTSDAHTAMTGHPRVVLPDAVQEGLSAVVKWLRCLDLLFEFFKN